MSVPSLDLPCRRILLVGFMGSGKSSVGSLLARALEWRSADMDREVERTAGRSIPEIFREEGEEGFREVEHRVARRLLLEDRVVLASGGGWPCRPGRLDGLPPGTLVIWLQVSPEVAVERAVAQGTPRPLLEGPDPEAGARKLLLGREPYYRRAHWRVDTDAHPPPEVVRRIVHRLRTNPERPLCG